MMNIKYYQVFYWDQYDGCGGILHGLYTSKEEAQKCADWHNSHPDPFMNPHFDVQEINVEDIRDVFIPPMLDIQYDAWIEDTLHPSIPDDNYLEEEEIPDEEWEELYMKMEEINKLSD